MHKLNLTVKFYWRQNENCSLGGSISDSSEILLQRGKGESQCMCDFGGGKDTCTQAHKLQKFAASFLKVTSSHKEQMPP